MLRLVMCGCQALHGINQSPNRMSHSTQPVFELTGGRLCLDFANTVDDRPTSDPKSRLLGYSDLIAFGVQTGVLSASDARREIEKAQGPINGGLLYRRSIAIRERIFRIFSAAAVKNRPPIKDMLALNADFRKLNSDAVLLPTDEGFRWTWRDKENHSARLLWQIVHSAMDLLVSNDMQLVRQCAGEDCDWLFLDNSRSGNRRWCEMKTCGNRHKAREFYRRKVGRRG